MSTNLSFNRKIILQISLVSSVILLFVCIITSSILAKQLLLPEEIESQEDNLQQQNMQKAINIIDQQTLEN